MQQGRSWAEAVAAVVLPVSRFLKGHPRRAYVFGACQHPQNTVTLRLWQGTALLTIFDGPIASDALSISVEQAERRGNAVRKEQYTVLHRFPVLSH
jgi:hypothetical protein